jgi:cilia- and flagella-associated protein 300
MDQSYAFFYLDKAVFPSYSSRDFQQKLQKWGFLPHMSLFKFRFDQPYNEFNPLPFLIDLVNSPEVASIISAFHSGKTVERVDSLAYTEIRAQTTTMDIFQLLMEKDLIYHNGNIKKVIPDFFEEIEICDKIRECLIVEESEDYGILDEFRNEFLFRIFEHVAIGGGVCQYEDEIEPYLEVVKGMYKDLVAVTKDSETNEFKVTSKVFQIQSNEQFQLFLNPHRQDFCYVTVDPGYRHVNVWSHKWTGAW